MQTRMDEVAKLAGVPENQVYRVWFDKVQKLYAKRQSPDVMEILSYGTGETGEEIVFWQAGNKIYMDDPTFGDVVAIDDLRYDKTIGLYDRRWRHA